MGQRGDTLALYVSCHGGPYEGRCNSVLFLGQNGDYKKGQTITSWWFTEYAKSIPKDRNLLIIFDVCFASGYVRLPLDYKNNASRWQRWNDTNGNVIFLAGSTRNELAYSGVFRNKFT